MMNAYIIDDVVVVVDEQADFTSEEAGHEGYLEWSTLFLYGFYGSVSVGFWLLR